MDKNQLRHIEKLKQLELEHSHSYWDYWLQYSALNQWHFWAVLALLLVPLILLLLFMDRKKALLLGFYGYNVHVFFSYIDAFGANKSFWFYPYKVLPVFPSSFSLDVSFVPVSYIFLYQWTLNKNKNYYLYMIGLAMILSFIFKPILSALELFQLDREANYFHLFLGYVLVGIVAKLVTNLFLYLQRHPKRST
ncbi:CBO0543 family protein [Neobacillus sp. Marseille-QA0830]